jgi:hypothetical protein
MSDIDFYTRLKMNNFSFKKHNKPAFYHFSGKATRLENESNKTTEKYSEAENEGITNFKSKYGFLPTHNNEGWFEIEENLKC